MGPRVRSSRALRAPAAVRYGIRWPSLLRRGRIRRQGARPALRGRRPFRAADDRRGDGGSRRGARRPWRADAWSPRLRDHTARPADRRATPVIVVDADGRRIPLSGKTRGPRADTPGRGGTARAAGAPRPLAAGGRAAGTRRG